MTIGLKFLNGPQEGEIIAVSDDKFIIGRETDCSLRLPRDLVSRHHCAIIQDGYTIRLRDLGSKNGSYINGHKISHEKVLNDRDIVTIGGIALQFKLDCSSAEISLEDTHTISLSNTAIHKNDTQTTKIDLPDDTKQNIPQSADQGEKTPDLIPAGEEDPTDFEVDSSSS